jgi:hypothetical protein
MDKKYINIDDLVRQRLSGVEESESHGAWMRMSELLDEEPKRKRPGIFFWRNTLGAVSALVLLGLAGMGSYKVSSYSHRNTEGQQLVASAMNGKANADAVNTAIRKEVVAANTTSGIHARHTGKAVATNSMHQPNNAHEDAHMGVNNDPEFNNNNGSKTVFLKNDNTTSATKNNNITPANNNTAGKKEVVAHKAEKAKHSSSPVATASNNTMAANQAMATTTAASESSNSKPANDNAQPLTNNSQKHIAADKQTDHSIASAAETASDSKLIVAAHAPASKGAAKSHAAAPKSHATKSMVKTIAATNSGDNTSITEKVIAEAIAAVKHTADKSEQDNKPVAEKKAVSQTASTTEAAKPAGSTASRKAANSTKPVAKKAQEHGVIEIPLASSGASAKEGNNPSKSTTLDETATPVAVTRERKMINKLLLRQTYIKTAPNDGYFRLDTISMEMLVKEQPEVNGNNNTGIAAASKKGMTTAGTNETNAGAETPADPNILAAAKEESASQKATEAKEKPVVKKTMSAAEKLSMAFNDMKSNVRGMQFAPGLTGGINGTFFGPSGYRGFQFGVTGELIYNDNLSVKGELKYFNRLNGNDFAMQDDYYTYSASGGQYVKTQQAHSVSFATVQSLELPISVRYTSGKFCFFAGGNTVYSFSVNAAESTLEAPTSIMVASKGTDNAPTITEGDFGSRFGVGYLFGMSYLVAPNFTLDLRNVQTLWDNASSQGAKTVSSQLYKHPSFQLSIGYRLGGKKSED